MGFDRPEPEYIEVLSCNCKRTLDRQIGLDCPKLMETVALKS